MGELRPIRLLLCAVALVAALAPHARANVAAATLFHTYVTPVVVVVRGAPVTFVNTDRDSHDVIALDARRPDGSAPWCFGRDPGTCPLFWSQLISAGATPVLGFELAEPGVPYEFTCSIHPAMSGLLVVLV